ncbi:MAG: aromatic ring-hydroxylating dioxygenase subunit alpha, partial [Actinomycetota bacterium]|nr:aromatic ring-hydroxylating dioxygenase subunit alpha [Actinomycetota bacterium]
MIRCPYHAWTYGLDGRLRAAPGFRGRGDFDPSELGLATVPVATWGGWLFVNADGEAAPLAAHLG